MGHARQRRPALLHPRQRAEPLALDAPRRASDGADDGRDQRTRSIDYRAADQGRSIRRRSSSARRSGAGAATSSAATTSSTAASTAGASFPIARTTAARTICRGCSSSFNSDANAHGRRLLDVFTVHYYPQGGEFSNDVSTAMQLRRNRSTRSLWDPNYVDETWINDRVQLIPRLEELGEHLLSRARPSASPNTTGAPRTTSTARPRRPTSTGSSAAKASTWRRAGRRPPSTTPTYKAMKMYRNYDGNQLDVRRHERRRVSAEPGHRLGLRGAAIVRRRAHRHGHRQGVDRIDGRDGEPRHLHTGIDGAGVAIDERECHHAPRGRQRQRREPLAHRPATEHHATRRPRCGKQTGTANERENRGIVRHAAVAVTCRGGSSDPPCNPPLRVLPSRYASALPYNAIRRAQAFSASGSLYTPESGGHQPCAPE